MKRPGGFDPGAHRPAEPQQPSKPAQSKPAPRERREQVAPVLPLRRKAKPAAVEPNHTAPEPVEPVEVEAAQPPRVARRSAKPSVGRAEPPQCSDELATVDLSGSFTEGLPELEPATRVDESAASTEPLDRDDYAVADDETHDLSYIEESPLRANYRASLNVRRAVRRRRRAERTEMKRFTAEARRRRRNTLIVFTAVGALLLFVVIGAFTPLMGMRTVEVAGASRLDTAAVTEALAGQKDVPLTLIDRSAVEEALSKFSIIQSYSLEMVPPHTMVVRVIERQPIAAVATTNGFELVDPAGVVIETTPERPAGFPLVLAVAPDPESAPFKAIANALLSVSPDLVARLDTVTATTGEDVVFKFADNGLNVIWGSSEDSAVKSVILEKMVAALAGQPVTNIDVSSIDAPVYS